MLFRILILNNFQIELIADFKNVDVFKDATVLTAIFVFRESKEINKEKNIKIESYTNPNSYRGSITGWRRHMPSVVGGSIIVIFHDSRKS